VSGDYVELSPADLADRWRERTVLECVDEAVAGAVDAKEYETPDAAMRWLLGLAWGDLAEACGMALNGRWSLRCDYAVHRIIVLTLLIGPQSWESVSVDLILNGVYERVHEKAGCPTPIPEDDRRRAREVQEGAWRRG
jgi:hypothetical protein